LIQPGHKDELMTNVAFSGALQRVRCKGWFGS